MREAKSAKKGREKKKKERKWENRRMRNERGIKAKKNLKINRKRKTTMGQSAKVVGFYVPYVCWISSTAHTEIPGKLQTAT